MLLGSVPKTLCRLCQPKTRVAFLCCSCLTLPAPAFFFLSFFSFFFLSFLSFFFLSKGSGMR